MVLSCAYPGANLKGTHKGDLSASADILLVLPAYACPLIKKIQLTLALGYFCLALPLSEKLGLFGSEKARMVFARLSANH